MIKNKIIIIIVWALLFSLITIAQETIKGNGKNNQPRIDSPLVLEAIEHPNEVYLFTKDDNQSLDYKFYNKSDKTLSASYSISIFTHDQQLLSKHEGEFDLNAGARIVQKLVGKTSSLPYGVYYAMLEVSEKGSNQKLLETKTYFGVTTNTQIRKANDGEFLYGMDVCYGHFYKNKLLLKWMDFTGTDIVRIGVMKDNLAEVETFYNIYKKHNLQLNVLYFPPSDADSLKRMNQLQKKCNFLEEMAGKYPAIKYYELGNEPDLFGFYPGPIEDYAYSMKEMYKAIKRGNTNTVVMNGGLSLFGDEGIARAKRFMEVLDTNYIDAFAYHAHGYGSVTERSVYNFFRQISAKVNKGNKPTVDTESGTPTVTMEQEKMQAATVLQKQVFAQSVGLEYLMWFRFLFFNEPYGNLFSEREPRPVVISYRNMVETLRSFQFYKQVDLGKKGIESYLFNEKEGNGRILVLWVNEAIDYNVIVKLASGNKQVDKVEILDLYGNAKPINELTDGSIKTDIDENPIYIRWQTREPSFEATKGKTYIDIQPETNLGINNDNTIEFEVKNHENKKVDATINLKANTSIPISFTPQAVNVKLAPNETKNIKISAFPKLGNKTIIWPDEWTIYTWLDSFNLAGITTIPKFIHKNDSVIYGHKVAPEANLIDFGKICGLWKVKALAIAFAEIHSKTDTLVTIGTAGDWWMDWYVNGEPVYNTLKNGNQGTMSITEHVFKIKLNKGRNLIAAKVLSGLGGWRLAFGNNIDLERTLNKTIDNVEINFSVNDKIIATEKSLVNFTKPIPFIHKDQVLKNELNNWDFEVAAAQIKDKGIFNFFDKFPDNTKWWKGEKDISATVWLRQDDKNLKIIIKVLDDKFMSPKSTNDIINNDAVLIALNNKSSNKVTEYVISKLNQNEYVGKYEGHYLVNELNSETQIKAKVSNLGSAVWYEIEIPKAKLSGADNYLNIMVNDGDWGERKQFIEWLPGLGQELNPELWYKLVL